MDWLENLMRWLVDTLFYWVDFTVGLILAHFLALGGFLLGLLIIARMFKEKRNPSNIFAWSLAVLFLPYIAVPLFFLLGGRKSRKMVEFKRGILKEASRVAEEEGRSRPPLDNFKVTPEPGNRFAFLPNGEVAFRELVRQIEEAQESIHIMTYILGNDETGRAIVDLLAKRAAEGVEVYLLLDAFGCLFTRRRFVDPIRKAGGRVVGFMPLLPLHSHTSANLRNHRKIAIFDRSRAMVGGQNIDLRFMGKRETPEMFIDFSAIIDGPVVRSLNFIFVSDWVFASGDRPEQWTRVLNYFPSPAGESRMEVLESGPEVEGDPLYERILMLVQECKRSLTIVTPYFLPDESLFRSLMVKIHSGRQIRIVLPLKSNHRLVDLARDHYVRQLHEAGAEILFFPDRVVHGKIFIADRDVAMIGSANIDMRSLFVNFEVGVFLYSGQDVQTCQGWVDELLPLCVGFGESQKAEAKKGRRIAEDFAHLVGPLL